MRITIRPCGLCLTELAQIHFLPGLFCKSQDYRKTTSDKCTNVNVLAPEM